MAVLALDLALRVPDIARGADMVEANAIRRSLGVDKADVESRHVDWLR